MGKIKVFDIVTQEVVFKPGDIIKGIVKLDLLGSKNLGRLTMYCAGESNTAFALKRYIRDRTPVEWNIVLFGENHTIRESGELSTGEHSFPFRFQLPNKALPPTLEGFQYGHVRYYLKAEIHRAWAQNYSATRCFIVLTTKDLNMSPNARIMPTESADGTASFLFKKYGPVRITASLDKSGYTPGECVELTIKLNNQCGRNVKLYAALYQNTEFKVKASFGQIEKKLVKRVITEIRTEIIYSDQGPSACSHEEETTPNLLRLVLVIPESVIPNCFENCPNIDVLYVVQVKASVPGTTGKLFRPLRLPIVMGTVALGACPAVNHDTENEPSDTLQLSEGTYQDEVSCLAEELVKEAVLTCISKIETE